MKLRYLTEKIEEIAYSTYATDSAQDIANWLVNKTKQNHTAFYMIVIMMCGV